MQTLFRLQTLKKDLHLERFDRSRLLVDPGLRWIYVGSFEMYIVSKNIQIFN